MTTLFSFVFGAIFATFVVAALVGHVLLLGAFVSRPFAGKSATSKTALPSGLQAAR